MSAARSRFPQAQRKGRLVHAMSERLAVPVTMLDRDDLADLTNTCWTGRAQRPGTRGGGSGTTRQ
jgi:hypothetical protein